MAGRHGAVQIAPEIRGAVMRGLKIVEGSKEHRQYAGMSLSEIFADMIMDGKVKDVIDMASKFTPKEMLIDVQGQISVDTAAFDPNLLKEVFSGSGITETITPEIQGSDTLETAERPTMVGLPQPS